jgi:hypothetical protein
LFFAPHLAEAQPAAPAATNSAEKQAAPAEQKAKKLDIRGVDAKEFIATMKATLESTKKFLEAIDSKIGTKATTAAKVALQDEIATMLVGEIGDTQKALLKEKQLQLNAMLSAMAALQDYLNAQGLDGVAKGVDAALGEIKKIDKDKKIHIVKAEYGDLDVRYGKISKAKRYCDFTDKAVTDCENKPFCTLSAASVCTDPAPQVEKKKFKIVYRCLGEDFQGEEDTKYSGAKATELLLSCVKTPDDGFTKK